MNKEDTNKIEKDNKQETKIKELKVKPMKFRGGAIGSRELTISKDIVKTLNIPKPKLGDIRVLYLGGVGEIGKNMYAIEYNDEILIIDCGLMFTYKDEHPGIDAIVPNVQYLEDRKDKIKALVVTHGHLDHIGGISILMSRFGNLPIYTTRLTFELIKARNSEFHNQKELIFREIEPGSIVKLTDLLELEFFSVTHTIPDSTGVLIKTPTGTVCFVVDLKLDHDNEVVSKKEEKIYDDVFSRNKILITLCDSTNAERPGFSIPEKTVHESLKNIIKKSPGRVIIATFASTIERNIEAINNAVAMGKKIVVAGRSMLTNLGIASDLGLLKVPKDTIVPIEEIEKYPKEKIVVFSTGSQGEEYSALELLSRNAHSKITLYEDDTIIFSSSTVPGNERAVQTIKDGLSRSGARIITYETSDVHSSGHAYAGELKWIHGKIKSKFVTPIHGYHYMLTAHKSLLQEIGVPAQNVVIPNNGSIVDVTADGKQVIHRDYCMPTDLIIVDGSGIGVQQDVVIKDRKILATEGIFIIIVMINQRMKKIRKNPDIISRGFVYLRESQDLINQARMLAKKTVESELSKSDKINVEDIKKQLLRDIRRFLLMETRKKPIIVPVIFFN